MQSLIVRVGGVMINSKQKDSNNAIPLFDTPNSSGRMQFARDSNSTDIIVFVSLSQNPIDLGRFFSSQSMIVLLWHIFMASFTGIDLPSSSNVRRSRAYKANI